MPIQVTCRCGASFAVGDEHAGRTFACPRCRQSVVAVAGPMLGAPAAAPLQYASMGSGVGYMAPMGMLQPPMQLDPKWRRPGLPPCHLVFIIDGAVVNCSFNPSAALMSIARGFSNKLKKQYDVWIGPPMAPGIPTAYVRIVTVDEGSQMLRYFLGIFAGGTTLEVEGNVVGPRGQNQPFHFKHRGRIGLFGGNSLNLLKSGGGFLGNKIAKAMVKA